MLGWSSVQLGPKDGDNGCEAKLTVVLRPGSVQNCIDEVNSEVIFVSIGEPSKKGRANCELQGFIAFLLDLKEDQVKLEDNVSNKSKTLLLSRLQHDKRSLIWQLQSKVGQKYAARFAAEKANAALREEDVSAKRRKEEQSEYRRLQEEADADAVAAAAAQPSPYAEKVLSRPTLPRGIRVRRFGEVDAEEPMEPPQPPDTGLPEEPTPKDDAADNTGGLQGLANYSSDESEEDESEES